MPGNFRFIEIDPDLGLFFGELPPGIYLFSEGDILSRLSATARFSTIKKHHFYRSVNRSLPYVRLIKRERTTAIKSVNFLHGCYIFDGKLVLPRPEEGSSSGFILSRLTSLAAAWIEVIIDNIKKPFLMLWTLKRMPSLENEALINDYLKLFKEMIDRELYSRP